MSSGIFDGLVPSRPPPDDGGPVLRLEGVVKRYGDFPAVRGLDLEVPRGEIFGFLGPNGAGKTTTIRMVAGVLRPTEGRILVGGDDVGRAPREAKSRIGYIPDRPFLYEKLSGGEFLRFVAGLWGRDGKETEDRADRFLEVFGLTEWKEELIESYSHGMRQKLLISSALIHEPELIVIDEPMVGLDPRAARLLKELLRTFVDRGGTVFLSSHTLEVVEVLCDEVAIINEGELVTRGSLEELRREVHAGEARLEDIFLRLTGGEEMSDVVASLRESEA